jgi:hypothetical protein
VECGCCSKSEQMSQKSATKRREAVQTVPQLSDPGRLADHSWGPAPVGPERVVERESTAPRRSGDPPGGDG